LFLYYACWAASDSEFFIVWKRKHRLIANLCFGCLEVRVVMGKMAVVTVELVDASIAESNSEIAEELLEWFKNEAVPAPWIKKVKKVVEGV
jgi:hypothetical protein